ncbi:uncharacterized protein [Diabrotica undecimpunctata]|uniref:uncharacterized protein n=1 Tax=Diabrotica undecimpunctata TaxID=50387 RepID=UPI003B642385
MSFEWNHEEVEKLIEAYRGKPELGNPKSNNYHIKSKKYDAWVFIADNIGCSVSEAKIKMTSLLSSYRREKVKMKKSMGTGKGRDDIFVSTWFAYKHFQFLTEKNAPVNRIDTETRDNRDDIENVSDNVDIENDMSGVLDEMNESQENMCHIPTEEATENAVQHPGPSNRVGPPKRQVLATPNRSKKQKNTDDPRLIRAFNILDSVTNVSRDECSTFGEHITEKLRKFTDHKRSILMHKINHLIYDAEMELYSKNQYVSASSESSSGYTPQ